MRDMLCAALVARSACDDMVFLTGDLGFAALEPLRDAMGPRFINCGVAEQNMVSVAAALASEGLEVWVYSIAPFCYARPFEQIRNDICLHRLPVRLLGNGGGFGYGVMGATHHAVEDCGVLLPGEAATARWQIDTCKRKAGLAARERVSMYRFETAVVGPVPLSAGAPDVHR